MRRTIIYRTEGTIVQPTPATTEPRRRELREKIHAALIAGLAVFLAPMTIFGGAYVGLAVKAGARVHVEPLIWIAGIAAIAALIVSCSFALDWSVKFGGYDWRVDARERQWVHDREKAERDYRRQLDEQERENHAPQVSPIDTLQLNAFTLLTRHFAGQKTTRDACCDEDRVMTQPEWNTVNAVFKALRWKRGRTFDPGPSLEMAWSHWLHNIHVDAGHVQQRIGKSWREVDI